VLTTSSTTEGIDIRDKKGTSVGDRQPVPNLNGTGKNETLPLAALVLMLQNDNNAENFFDHWEKRTGQSVNQVLGAKRGVADPKLIQSSESYLPLSFFEKSIMSGLPVFGGVKSVLYPGTRNTIIDEIHSRKPAKTGDLLWLFERFLIDMFPNGGTIDVVPGSLLPASVYNKIAEFCKKKAYMHHPHWRTMLALTSMPEMGLTERHLPANTVTLAVQTLRKLSSPKGQPVNKPKKGSCKGLAYEMSRQQMPLKTGSKCPKGVIAPTWDLPWTRDVTEDPEDEGAELMGEATGKSDSDAPLFGKRESKDKNKSKADFKKLVAAVDSDSDAPLVGTRASKIKKKSKAEKSESDDDLSLILTLRKPKSAAAIRRDAKTEADESDLDDVPLVPMRRKKEKKAKKEKKRYRSSEDSNSDPMLLDEQYSERKKLVPKSIRKAQKDIGAGSTGVSSTIASSSKLLKTPAPAKTAVAAYATPAATAKASSKRKVTKADDDAFDPIEDDDSEPILAPKRQKKDKTSEATSSKSKSKPKPKPKLAAKVSGRKR
jgi:hypothetical protein